MVLTYKKQFNKKFNFPPDESHSLKEIANSTGYSVKHLQIIFDKGIGAYNTNPGSVRPQVKSPEQWAYARVYSAVMGGKAATIDKAHLIKTKTKTKVI